VAATALGGDKVLAAAAGGAKGDQRATAAADPGAQAADRDAALLAGTRLHLLLEHLPGLPPQDWPARAADLLAGAEGGLPTAPELTALLDELAEIAAAESLAPLLSPPPGATVLREAPLSAPLPGGLVLSGTIDRLVITSDRITIVDYKSNAAVPDTPEATPEGYLRQMAAYRHAARAIWPGRAVECVILWTRARQAMTLPDPLLDLAWAAALRGLEPAAAGP
ncbi:MAG TPA: double-strand break repair helicase AddA, partial [Paracoccus solventivorans]